MSARTTAQRHWTSEEIDTLKRIYGVEGAPAAAAALGRSLRATVGRAVHGQCWHRSASVLTARAAAGLPLFHPRDSRGDE